MRRSITLILVLSIILSATVGIGIYYKISHTANNAPDTGTQSDKDKIDFAWDKVRVAEDYMYPDNFEYIDYAKEVKFDYEQHPLLLEQGFFWCKYNEATNSYIKVDADSEEGAALVDPNKPTIVNIHGMLNGGGRYEEMYWFPNHNLPAEELGYDYPVQMIKFWADQGYNVGMYSYNKFADENSAFFNIEEKMWSIEGPIGIRYATPEGTYVEDVSEYTITEHFAAEWIRATNILPEGFGDKEIRFAAHSMGGQVVMGGTFLLTELASVGQIDKNFLPDRICMEDTFFGTFIPVDNTGNEYTVLGTTDLPCRWSGKTIPSTGECVVEALKDIAANDIVIEYYTYPLSFLWMMIKEDMRKDILENSVTFMVNPDFTDMAAQHNGIRELYLVSILLEYEATEGMTNADKAKYFASIPTEELKEMVGTYYAMETGGETILNNDDTFSEHDIYTIINR
ncbi:MAG: hypothetical protein J6V83_05320 [Clostridia bacterium]|nr:hypothetical protein [Clostridia bacterium]MBO7156805.1 hypothetical protein [Clostridia bacterium]